MKKLLFLWIVFLCYGWSVAKAQDATVVDYTGTINGNLAITMQLTFSPMEGYNNAYKITGWYYYNSQGSNKKLTVEGMWQMSNLLFSETVNGAGTGAFELKEEANGVLKGTWSNGKSTLPVYLKAK
ncbi:MAG: hypothetical protein EAZ55_10245 [Cytophagales bacterium]|nr:MAG: hypothetical protein EAZ55_10245 [Cytophagales bacterium]